MPSRLRQLLNMPPGRCLHAEPPWKHSRRRRMAPVGQSAAGRVRLSLCSQRRLQPRLQRYFHHPEQPLLSPFN
eukprot:10290977-Alexandrium_andersonii.AAC.1